MIRARLQRHLPNVGPQALALLDPSRGPVEPPIRSEIFGSARFQSHGRSLGLTHEARLQAWRSSTFFPRLQENIGVLREAQLYIGLQEHVGHHVSPAGEWLLDNFYIVAAQVKEIHDGLPRRYFRDLPVLQAVHLSGLPRIYGVAWAFVAHTDGAFHEGLLTDFLKAYQETRELTLGELWALPTTLRVVLIENLRRLSERVATTKAAREAANLWCDRLNRASRVHAQPVLASMNERGLLRPFALQALQRLQADPGPASPKAERSREALRLALAHALPDPAQAQAAQQAEEAADNMSVANAITALRLIGDTDWRALITGSSSLIRRMLTSPTFGAERDDTQDGTLHAIERLARRCGQSELAVADKLLGMIAAAPDPSMPDAVAQGASPSYWLRGSGTEALRASLGLQAAWLAGWPAWWQQVRLPVYLASLLVGSLALTLWVVLHAADVGTAAPWLLLTACLALWPASEAVVAGANRLISEWVPATRLPRLALAAGIPADHRVLVVMPAMLVDPEGVRALVARLERNSLANLEPNAQFALLSDFTDSAAEYAPADEALLQAAMAAIDAAEARRPGPAARSGAERRFLLLHRQRRWSETEQRWIGWERKRGKLEQLLAQLADSSAPDLADPGGHASNEPAFMTLGPCSQPAPDTRYVVTLDSDTLLPPGALRELVGVAAHPLNRPRVDKGQRRVVSGYGILQPRIVTPLPTADESTPYHWLFAGQCGVDPYSAVSSEVHQDVFGEGIFSGKGLLNVRAVHEVLGGRLPEGAILSHDLTEGAIARCGGVSDVSLLEAAPVHPDVAAARLHRWARGDWQLLPMMWHARRFGIAMGGRWKMLDNLRRSLVAPASAGLLMLSLAGGPLPPWVALALVVAAFGTGPLLGTIAGLAPSRDDLALGYFYRQALTELSRAALGVLWNLALLLQQSLTLSDAIGRALWRLLVSRRHLLQWTTAAASEAAARHSLTGLLRLHGGTMALALIALAALLWAGTPAPSLAIGLCLAWMATPLWIAMASRPRAWGPGVTLGREDRSYLLGVARDTWRYFEDNVGAASHHLPPDNVQTLPTTLVAHRTSPTNIGLYLLALACAREHGWINTEQMLDRFDKTLCTLGRLARHRGHFLNWYDTGNLEALLPLYVSTVDSGNLCIHLLAVAGACEAIAGDAKAQTADPVRARLREVAAQCRQLAMAAEFGFLYDTRRRLFHIGYRTGDQQLDGSYYDLLASEARQASLWAIAKGDVPANHWAALGRPFYAVGTRAGLRSWSGSMFEYLMPGLVLDEPAGSALASASLAAVREQRAFASQHDVPWGMSECAYAASDHTLAYQYAPQGVPRLALRRTPPDDLVVAPYATALAALCVPQAAAANLRRLQALGARKDWGFMEALDYSPERQTDSSRFAPVQTFMAHHQGMSLVALSNVLLGNVVRRWTMADARIAAVAPLLQERVPSEVARLLDPPPAWVRDRRADPAAGASRDVVPGENALQPTQLLSNGQYSVTLRANGAGWSRFAGADVSRWRDDALRDAYGSFFYLRRVAGTAPVSITQHPAPDPAAHYKASFHADRVVLEAAWPDLRTCCTVWVSPEDDIELRRIEVWNTSAQAVDLELISMFEVVLAAARADEAHPAFTNLFVTADWRAQEHALYFARRPRLADEEGLHAVHFVAHADDQLLSVQPQTDRARWLGRGHDASHPLAHFEPAAVVDGEQVTGLDPLAALSMRLHLPPHGKAELVVCTAAAVDRDTLEGLVDRYRQRQLVERSGLMSATLASVRLRAMRVGAEDRAALLSMTTLLTSLLTRPPGGPDDPACDRRTLWRLGISGDRPLIVVNIGAAQGLRLVHALTQALQWWCWGGVACDLVLINGEQRSYLMPVQAELLVLADRFATDCPGPPANRVCSLHVVFNDDVSPAEQAALRTLARARLRADGRPLAHHVSDLVDWHDTALQDRQGIDVKALPVRPWRSADTASQGTFDAGSGGFKFTVAATMRPQRPWVNVLANPDFGTQVSDSGSGYTWAGNSRLHALTPWSNDPVADPAGEWFLLQDLRSREVWSLTGGAGSAPVTVTHGPGWTTFQHRHEELEIDATWCVDPQLASKQLRVKLTQQGTRTRRLRVIGVCEWLMGERRADRTSVHTAYEAVPAAGSAAGCHAPGHTALLLATQADGHGGFGGSTAFLHLRCLQTEAEAAQTWTCDRRELFDLCGRRVVPTHFSERAGQGLDPCAAVDSSLNLGPGQTSVCVFTVGHGSTLAAARAVARAVTAKDPAALEAAVCKGWLKQLSVIEVHTPDPLFDVMVNRWLLYQTMACRLWARAGFYQAGGAFGFRDQLQDTMALAVTAPGLLRQQVLLSASRQFMEGDVQHWWHAPTGAGVRTRMSDDLLWLPEATARYIDVSGDASVLDVHVPFLEGEAIAEDAEDRYDVPRISEQQASLYEHCARTIDYSLSVGVHGLPLMGTGDWNDGMNRVGHGGRGESVWLGWFLCRVVAQFLPIARQRGDSERVAAWETADTGWRSALQGAAWDGDWFMRAFFDDGSPLGSHTNAECRIDLIAQAWSVLSGVASPAQQHSAMAAAGRLLVDEPHGLVRLLDPPLAHAMPEAGYIQAYPAGVRENGGQYSHAGVWALMARAALGDGDGAWQLFKLLSPAHRAADAKQGAAYQIEPYVMAGDVYTQPPYTGRGGWSWYTGSAAWMHRAAVESICGLQVRDGRACLRPCLPSHWPEVHIQLRQTDREFQFTVCQDTATSEIEAAQASGAHRVLAGEWITLADEPAGRRYLLVMDAGAVASPA